MAYYKEVMGGIKLPEINENLVKSLKDGGVDLTNGLLDEIAQNGTLEGIKAVPEKVRQVFVTAHELEAEDHIKMQAAFQKYTDNAVSKTINLRADSRVEDVASAFMMAWEMGCKGMTVYRDSSRQSQVLNVGYLGKKAKVQMANQIQNPKSKKTKENCPQCGAKMLKAEGCATCPSCAFSVCSL